jgi:translocation and assembly module TamA
MLQIVAGRRAAALSAALVLILCPAAAFAQQPAPAPAQVPDPLDEVDRPLDPSAPLEEWPDLGVPWPDMEADRAAPIPAGPDANTAGASVDGAAARTYSYRVEGLDGTETATLMDQFRTLSTLEEHRRDAANAAQIDRRARADADLMAELLRAHGYYDALVTTAVDAAPGGGFAVTLEVEPGPLYRFSAVTLPGLEAAAGADAGALRGAFGVAAHDPVNAMRVSEAEAALRAELGRRGFAFAEVGETQIVVDHDSRTATLVLPVEPAGTRRFGHVLIEGRPLFSARHIETIARFREGEPYTAARIEDLRQALVATGLVSTINIRPVAREGSDIVDLAVTLEPAPMRTIAGEAGYGTGEGVRLELSWQHRNLIPARGRGHLPRRRRHPRATALGGLPAQQFHAPRPGAERPDRRQPSRPARLRRAHLHPDRRNRAADQHHLAEEMDLVGRRRADRDRRARRRHRQRHDAAADLLHRRHSRQLGYDGSNDLLDPTRGFRVSARFSPEASLQDGSFFYARAQIDGSFYQPVSGSVTLAGRTRLGTIIGAGRDRIAPSRRFYAGGGGSVRGYGFQELGPRDPVFDDPIGGRSLTEFSLEARIRVRRFRDRAVRRCRQRLDLASAALRQPPVRRRHRRPLPHPLRPDPGRCRNAAQPAPRRPEDRRLRLARPGLLNMDAVLDPTVAPVEEEPPARVRSRTRIWLARIVKTLIAIALVLALGLAAFLAFLDTEAGHRFIVNRIAAMTPASGLRIQIGRIDGSIYGRTRLIDVRVYDPHGLFAEAPRIDMDWRPVDYVFGALTLNEVDSDLVILRRTPRSIRPPRRSRSCPITTFISAGSTSGSSGSGPASPGASR